MNIARRSFHIRFGAFFAGLISKSAYSAPLRELPTAKSLPSEISAAIKTGYPLLVLINLDNCPYCKIARENYLLPLMNEQSMPIVQINFRHLETIVDTKGSLMTQDQWVRAWGVKVAPTVLFLGKDGKELAPRLAGGSTSDFYGVYLDERIRTAQIAIANYSHGKN